VDANQHGKTNELVLVLILYDLLTWN